MAKLSPKELQAFLKADFETGRLYWKPRTPDMFIDNGARSQEWQCNSWNSRCAGKEAGKINSDNGYLITRVLATNYYTHRVLWALWSGEWPPEQLDHIDHDRSNNSIANLRCVSAAENRRNTSLLSNNKSGVTGVFSDPRSGGWIARIKVKGRNIHLGRFADLRAATEVRLAAERKYGFHKNHGASQ